MKLIIDARTQPRMRKYGQQRNVIDLSKVLLEVMGDVSLSQLSDTIIDNPVDYQILVYNSATGSWENGFIIPRIREFVVLSSQTLVLPAIEGDDGNMYVTANLTSGTGTLRLPDTTGFSYNYVVRINNKESSTSNLILEASTGFSTGGQSLDYVVNPGPPQTIEVPPGDYVILESSSGNVWEQLVKVSPSSTGDNLGNHTATQDLDMANFDILNPGNIQNAEGNLVALTGGALVPLSMSNPFGTYYGTHVAPATSGNVSIAAPGVVSGYAEILYQAGSAPTFTGITDQNVATNWDATDINVIIVYQHADGTYIAMHGGTR